MGDNLSITIGIKKLNRGDEVKKKKPTSKGGEKGKQSKTEKEFQLINGDRYKQCWLGKIVGKLYGFDNLETTNSNFLDLDKLIIQEKRSDKS